MGSPYSFGDAKAHAPNSSSKFVKLTNGKWEVATPEFVVLPN
jgi:hypothetical protein